MVILNEGLRLDQNLWEQVQAGNETAFKHLYEKYWEELLVHAKHRLNSLELAQEAVQDLFTDLWVRKETIIIQRELSSYLYTALKYKVLDSIRKQKVRDKYIDSVLQFAQRQENITLEQIEYRELSDSIRKAVQKLPPKCKEIFEMSRFEHFTHQEIAQKLGLSKKTVENQINKAKKFLKAHLREVAGALAIWIHF